MIFQIKKTKDYLRARTSLLLETKTSHECAIEKIKDDLEWIDKCRDEINTANKLLREKK